MAARASVAKRPRFRRRALHFSQALSRIGCRFSRSSSLPNRIAQWRPRDGCTADNARLSGRAGEKRRMIRLSNGRTFGLSCFDSGLCELVTLPFSVTNFVIYCNIRRRGSCCVLILVNVTGNERARKLVSLFNCSIKHMAPFSPKLANIKRSANLPREP